VKVKIWKASLLLIVIFMLSAATSARAATLTTIIPSPTIDQTSVLYANGYIFVSGYTGGDIEVISDATNAKVADIQVYLGAPYGLAYDSNKGEIWAATTGGAAAFSDVPPFNSVANVTDTNGFELAAFDAKTGEVFMAFNGPITVISDNTNTVTATITQSVDGIVDDSAKGEVFASQYLDESGLSTGNVYVISAQTNTVTATIALTGVPGSLVYDSGKGEIFVQNSLPTYNLGGASPFNLQVISDSTNKVVATVNLSASDIFGDMAYNANKDELYMNSRAYLNATIITISDKTNSVLGTINDNGTSAGGIAYDSATSSIYAVNYEGDAAGYLGSVAVISDPSSSSSVSNPTPTVTASTGTSSTAIPTSTPKVPEFSNTVLPLVAAAIATVTLFAIVATKKKTVPK